MLILMPSGPPTLGKHLALWFGFFLLVSMSSPISPAARSLPARTTSRSSAFTGTTAFLAYGVGQIVDSIWRG
jgi:hypothetical protein